MKDRKELIVFVQKQLEVTPDGIAGPITIRELNIVVREIPDIADNWPVARKITGLVQVLAKAKGIDTGKVDGWLGPQTREAFNQLKFLSETGKKLPYWRKDHLPTRTKRAKRKEVNPNNWPAYSKIRSVFGQPGYQLVQIDLPYPMRLAWDTSDIVHKITCHKRVADSLLRILNNILDFYGEETIQQLGLDLFGGCYNDRKMRGGSKRSTHAWGVAIDLNPDKNELHWNHTKAAFARPAYDYVLACFAEEGWVNLGEAKDYDWMHFQAVKLR